MLATDWFMDPVLRAISRDHPTVMALWPVLVAEAKSVSHFERNPDGRIETDTEILAVYIRATEDQVQGCLDALVEGEMVTVEPVRHGVVVGLVAFNKWQNPRGSAADRKRAQRERASREKASESHEHVTAMSHDVTKSHIEGEREGDNYSSNELLSQTDSGSAPRKVKAKTAEQVATEVAAHRQTLGTLAPMVDTLVDLLAAENKTGQVAESRALRILWEPLAALSGTGLTRQQMAYGLEAAITKAAPNATYVKRAAQGAPTTTTRPGTPATYGENHRDLSYLDKSEAI